DRHHWAEDLLAHDIHFRSAIGNHGRLELEPLPRSLSPDAHLGAPADCLFDSLLDDLHLAVPGHGAGVNVGLRGITLTKSLGELDDLVDQLIVHCFVREDAFDRNAHLTLVGERAPHESARGAIDVGIGTHDGGRLATELERVWDETFAAG